MKAKVSLRERKKNEVRQRIVDAATDLFARKGFDRTTIEEIAATAGVSRRTFFRYFASKELVIFPHHNPHLKIFREMLRSRRVGEPKFETIHRACTKMASMFVANRDEHLRQQQIIRDSEFLIARGDQFDVEWEDAIVEALLPIVGAAKGERRRARMAAAAILALFISTLKEWYDSDCRSDLARLSAEALELIRGVVEALPESGRKGTGVAARGETSDGAADGDKTAPFSIGGDSIGTPAGSSTTRTRFN